MRPIESNGIKIYELSKGSVIPEYLTSRRQKQLKQKYNLKSTQLDVIHDLAMPDLSTSISVSPDENYMFVLGAYSPRVRCYELDQLSMKFERNCDELPTKIAHISEDYTKFVILEGQKTLSFHSSGGIHKKVSCENVVVELLYSPFKNELFLPDCTGNISVLNLEKGKLSSNIFKTKNAISMNCGAYNFKTDMILTGDVKGLINCYDCRTDAKPMIFNVGKAPKPEYMKKSYVPEICKIAFNDPFRIGVGTDKGMFHLYDIRNHSKPFSSRDLDYEFPVKNIIFHEEKVIATVKSVFKIWEPIENDEGKIVATYDTNSDINDFFQFPRSGLFFSATNEPKIQTYFIPRIGDAPPWCEKLSNLIVEVETESQSMYDSHTFVTREEIDELGLAALIGTSNLRAYMHGYYISNETYKRAKNALQAESTRKREAADEIDSQSRMAEARTFGDEDVIPDPPFNVALKSLVGDAQFADLFSDPLFVLDEQCRGFEQVQMEARHIEKKRRKKMLVKERAKRSRKLANAEQTAGDSDSDSASMDD